MNQKFNNSLIVRLPNWVGDVVMSLPALQALQKLGIELHLLGKAWIKQLLPALNCELYDLSKGVIVNSLNLRKIPEKKILLLPNSFSSALMARLAGKKAIGYYADARGFLLESGLNKKTGQHELQYFWDISSLAVKHWFTNLSWPVEIPNKINLPLLTRQQDQAQQLLKQAGITESYWVLCPMAHGKGENGGSKIWPHWRQLCTTLQQQGQTLIACPGPGEVDACRALLPGVVILPNVNLGVYAAILSSAEQVIANDSGPMHLAAAVGTPTLGIFGVSDPQRVRPWGEEYIGEKNNWPAMQEVLQNLISKRPKA